MTKPAEIGSLLLERGSDIKAVVSQARTRAKRVADQTRLSAKATWYLFSEDGRPLGQVYRGLDEMVPEVGGELVNGTDWSRSAIVGFEELQYACEMRRFRVVVRVIE